jgi:hypothetical protein
MGHAELFSTVEHNRTRSVGSRGKMVAPKGSSLALLGWIPSYLFRVVPPADWTDV